jgi:hypothetical protein
VIELESKRLTICIVNNWPRQQRIKCSVEHEIESKECVDWDQAKGVKSFF